MKNSKIRLKVKDVEVDMPERMTWAVIGVTAVGVLLFGLASLFKGIAAIMGVP